jgi:hypothetical protein
MEYEPFIRQTTSQRLKCRRRAPKNNPRMARSLQPGGSEINLDQR